MVPQRPGIAFVEYSDEGQAGTAMQGLQGFKLATGEACMSYHTHVTQLACAGLLWALHGLARSHTTRAMDD